MVPLLMSWSIPSPNCSLRCKPFSSPTSIHHSLKLASMADKSAFSRYSGCRLALWLVPENHLLCSTMETGWWSPTSHWPKSYRASHTIPLISGTIPIINPQEYPILSLLLVGIERIQHIPMKYLTPLSSCCVFNARCILVVRPLFTCFSGHLIPCSIPWSPMIH